MVNIFLLSIGVICSFLLQVNGHCTISGCKGFPEEIDDVLVTTSVMLSVGKQRNERSSTSSCEDQNGEEKACPSGFDFLPGADGCFKVIFQSLNWSETDKACRGVMPGAHLVAITNAAKQEAIAKYLKREFNKTESSACLKTLWTDKGKSVWIGGQRQNSTGCDPSFVWKTLDGVEIPFVYSNWLAGRPNCLGKNEHCAHVSADIKYTWNDARCGLLSCSLCELERNTEFK